MGILFLPLCGWLLFFTVVLKARYILGRFPHYDNPDPKSINLGVFSDIGDIGWAIYFCAWIIALLLLPVYIILFRKSKRNHIIAAVLILVFYFLFVWKDPGGFIEWIAD